MTDDPVTCLDGTNIRHEEALAVQDLEFAIWPEDHKETTPERRARDMLKQYADYDGPPAQRPRTFAIFEDGICQASARVSARDVMTPDGALRVLALSGVCTRPERRRQGLGRAVAAAALHLVDDGAFDVSLFQTPVPAFYERLGARQVHNPFFSAERPERGHWCWNDRYAMVYPADYDWPEGLIDIQGHSW